MNCSINVNTLCFIQCVTVTRRERLRRSVTRQRASVCVRKTSCSPAVTAVHLVTITTPRVKVSLNLTSMIWENVS